MLSTSKPQVPSRRVYGVMVQIGLMYGTVPPVAS